MKEVEGKCNKRKGNNSTGSSQSSSYQMYQSNTLTPIKMTGRNGCNENNSNKLVFIERIIFRKIN